MTDVQPGCARLETEDAQTEGAITPTLAVATRLEQEIDRCSEVVRRTQMRHFCFFLGGDGALDGTQFCWVLSRGGSGAFARSLLPGVRQAIMHS